MQVTWTSGESRHDDVVVGAELRVPGLAGLRVADAAVVPRSVPVTTNAATTTVGGTATDLVRGTSA